jgi:hypothetical protein
MPSKITLDDFLQIRINKKIKKKYFKACKKCGLNASGDLQRLIYERMRKLETDVVSWKSEG